MALTDQQSNAVKGFRNGESMIWQAGAGTGKSATICEVGKANPNKKIYVFAFNKAIVEELASKLPSNMKAYTIHGYAFGRTGRFYSPRLNNNFRMSNKQTAEFLGLTDIDLDDHNISAAKCASLVMRGVQEFSKSADWSISGYQIPRVNGLMPEEMKYVRAELDSAIKEAWQDIANPKGQLNFSQINYVKLWAMDPKVSHIAADAVMIDEAQDVMACVIPVLQRRARNGKQLILAGDEYQSINEWNGAQNSMGQFPDFTRYMFDRSFRFPQEIADIANLHLEAMEADMQLTGNGSDPNSVGSVEFPDAILCRTNAGTIEEAIRELELGKSVALQGKTDEFTSIADAALTIQAGKPSDHYLFTAFQTWAEVQNFAKSDDVDAQEVKTWVNLIDSYGAQAIKDMTDALVSTDNADVIVSTAHKTKGMQYGDLRVGNDFPEPTDRTHPATMADHMLHYVTVSRAQRHLQPGSLAVAATSDD